MKFLITSGGTKTPIDSVRHVGNMSSGKLASEIAWEALRQNHRVTYLHAKDSAAPHLVQINCCANDYAPDMFAEAVKKLTFFTRDDFEGTYLCNVFKDFDSYAKKLETTIKANNPDVVLLAAAVSDYAPIPQEGKINSESEEITLTLKKLPKLIRQVKQWVPNTFLVGFKLLDGSGEADRIAAAKAQIYMAGSDIVVVNDLKDMKAGMHTLYLYLKRHVENKEEFAKIINGDMLAKRLVEFIVQHMEIKDALSESD